MTLLVFVWALAAGVLALVGRCVIQRRRPTNDDGLGIGLVAAGIGGAVDLFVFGLGSETQIGTTRSIYLCVVAVVLGLVAANKALDLLTRQVTPGRVKRS